MEKKAEFSISHEIKIIFVKIFLWVLLVMIGATTLFFVGIYEYNNRISSVVSQVVREDLLVRNFREVLTVVKSNCKDAFIQVRLLDSENSELVKLHLENNQKNMNFKLKFHVDIKKMVYFSDNSRDEFGVIIFTYNFLKYFWEILFGWIVVFFAFGLFAFITKSKFEIQQHEKIEAAKALQLSLLAAQVAHDIRSPLAALDMAMKDAASIPESKRVMIRESVNRIHDIANNLLATNRSLDKKEEELDHNRKVVLLPGIVESIITEKRIEYRSKMNVNIFMNLGEGAHGLFADVSIQDLKRIISNLINNSVDAFDSAGIINVDMYENKMGEIEIVVKDNGVGIPSDVISRLGQKGETYGKKSGNGLGLYYAKKIIGNWGGDLNVKSIEREGTSVILTLPKAPTPNWFVSEFSFKRNSNLVVIDDDTSIHQIWEGRFKSAGIEYANIKTVHFSDPESVISWWNENSKDEDTLFLVDYEFIGSKLNGLDIIKQLNIAKQSVLVTSRFEESHIISSCEELSIGLAPKTLVDIIPINIISDEQNNCGVVLIDDDALIRLVWESSAKEKNVSLKVYENFEKFFDELINFDKNIEIYVDSNLGDGIKGEEVAKIIFEKGYKNIFLTTGYDTSEFGEMPWIKKIVGKESPWS